MVIPCFRNKLAHGNSRFLQNFANWDLCLQFFKCQLQNIYWYFTWQEFLPDESVFLSVECVAAVKKFVKLVIRMAEFVEAEFPETHVFEWTLSVLPWDEPIRTGKGHQEQKPSHKRSYGAIEQSIWNSNKKYIYF